ncbi:hypothetical protein C8C76_11726 [Halanaerobium saccharolyticum]|jgi:hypothetical protein|uniref:Uncharacterized protein n=1 Tax=Halanaerobium saccharolyticum TaxID=43595 RepID=A0A2T5RIY3_9FIRM|nr:hypothetical protein C8C76_11726 [Halanaerobium saccharolyticum]
MLKKNSIISFMLGVLSYFVISTVLEKFGVERDFIIEFIIISIILLSYLVIKYKKSNDK